MRTFGILATTMFCALMLAGCGFFPHSGPDFRDIQASATAGVPSASVGGPLPYAIVDLTSRVLSITPDTGVESIYKSFGGGKGGAPNIRVAEGDVIAVTVFESQAGGLFIPAEASVRPGNFVNFPNQIVDRTGAIGIPYAGSVPVVGRSLFDIQEDIRRRLEPKAIQPQVIVSVVSRAAYVSVVGDVNAPSKFIVDFSGDHVLDMISKAGGIRFPGWDTYVTLQRGGRKATIFFNQLVDDPKENIFVQLRDIIYVYRQQRFFSVFGASGIQSRFDFDTEHVYLSDAAGRAIGFADQQANPGEVYLYRLENRTQLEKVGVDVTTFPPEQMSIPTVYHINFRRSDGFFLAQSFPLRDHDVIYVSNSDAFEFEKVLNLASSISNTASNVVAAQQAVRAVR